MLPRRASLCRQYGLLGLEIKPHVNVPELNTGDISTSLFKTHGYVETFYCVAVFVFVCLKSFVVNPSQKKKGGGVGGGKGWISEGAVFFFGQ